VAGEGKPQQRDEQGPDKTENALDLRLRALKWPEPPSGARERGLLRLRQHLEESGSGR
jgi:hypothetical protein